jgi:hypothetical protein
MLFEVLLPTLSSAALIVVFVLLLKAQRPNIQSFFQKLMVFLYIGLGVFFLIKLAQPGPDYPFYVSWAKAFANKDIFQIYSVVLSPAHVPLTQWSFGPGLVYSISSLFAEDFMLGGIRMGIIFAIVAWYFFSALLYRISNKNVLLTILGIGGAFMGTHLGYYSLFHASESLSYMCLSVIAYWLFSRNNWKWYDSLLFGVMSSLLLITRVQLALYLVPAYILLLYKLSEKSPKWRIRLHTIRNMVMAIAPLMIAFIQIGYSNYWMTGSVFKSAYMFGNTNFSSVDLMHPLFLTVLFHSWHGLLSYHPLYLFGIVAIVFLIVLKPRLERAFFWGLLLVILLHLYLQASWYTWWLGTFTFGQRGMGIAALVLIPSIIYLLSNKPQKPLIYPGLLFIGVSSLWSFLLWQNAGAQFYKFKALISSQAEQLGILVTSDFLGAVLIISAGLAITLRGISKPERPVYIVAVLIVAIGYQCLSNDFIYSDLNPMEGTSFLLSLLKSLLLGLIPFTIYGLYKKGRPFTDRVFNGAFTKKIELISTVSFFCLFVGISAIFFIFASATDAAIKEEQWKNHEFEYKAEVYLPEVKACYREYLSVPGFQKEKERLRNYIEYVERHQIFRIHDGVINKSSQAEMEKTPDS